MSKKKKIFILAATGLSILAILGALFSLKGTVSINSNVPIGSVKVGKKEYPVNDGIASLPVGPHRLTVSQDFYEKSEISVFVMPWGKKSVSFSLTLNKDGEQIIDNAKTITTLTATFSSNQDSVQYLAAIKRYIDDSTYQDLSFEISDAAASKETNYPASLPVVNLPLNNTYIQTINGEILATVGVTKAADPLSLSSMQYRLEKIGGKWIVTNIIYN